MALIAGNWLTPITIKIPLKLEDEAVGKVFTPWDPGRASTTFMLLLVLASSHLSLTCVPYGSSHDARLSISGWNAWVTGGRTRFHPLPAFQRIIYFGNDALGDIRHSRKKYLTVGRKQACDTSHTVWGTAAREGAKGAPYPKYSSSHAFWLLNRSNFVVISLPASKND